jgi:hypothetical protein
MRSRLRRTGMGLIEGDLFGPVSSQVCRNGVMAAVLARAGMQAVSTMIEGTPACTAAIAVRFPTDSKQA